MIDTSKKLLTLDEAARRTARAGSNVVLAAGVFELLLPASVRYLRKARGRGEELIVAVRSDALLVAAGREPLVREEQRLRLVAAVRWVDGVLLWDEGDLAELVARLRPARVAAWGSLAFSTDETLCPEKLPSVEITYINEDEEGAVAGLATRLERRPA
jgi:bifunctional ADP-heptose synthase (sugar kinase/adenylyltransferase)